MLVHIGKARVVIEKGDISDQEVDAIAISANDRLWMGDRISEALKHKAGEDIEIEAMKQGPAEIGSVVDTTAGDLAAKYILHTVIMGQDLKPTEESVQQGIKNLLIKADTKGLRSVAIAPLGAEEGKLPAITVAKVMAAELIDALLDAKNIVDVRIILPNEGIFKAFADEFGHRFSR